MPYCLQDIILHLMGFMISMNLEGMGKKLILLISICIITEVSRRVEHKHRSEIITKTTEFRTYFNLDENHLILTKRMQYVQQSSRFFQNAWNTLII
jgi:ABC-type maltose transport system permease subunit